MNSIRHDMEELVAEVERQGWRVERRKGSYAMYSPDGKTIVSAALTPSDHRAIRNVRAYLRRGGFRG